MWQVALSGAVIVLYLTVWAAAFWWTRDAKVPIGQQRRFDRGVRVAHVNIYLPLVVGVYGIYHQWNVNPAVWCSYGLVGVLVARVLQRLRHSYRVYSVAYVEAEQARRELNIYREELAAIHQRSLDMISGIAEQVAAAKNGQRV